MKRGGPPLNVVCLFDRSGVMALPWAEAGYQCWTVDVAPGDEPHANVTHVQRDLSAHWLPPFDRADIAFVAAFPPCDHLAVSGARWFRGKGLRKLSKGVELFATAAEFCEWSRAPYMIENPVSTISTYWRKPDHRFHPYEFTGFCLGDNYTKATCLWTGNGFVMPPPSMVPGEPPDDRIHKATANEERSAFRSKTPLGFARAVFAANHNAERGGA